MRKIAAVFMLLALSCVSAFSQSSPGLVFGQVPTAAQWNSFFTAKQDYLGFTPLNPSSISGTLPIVVTPGGGVVSISAPTAARTDIANNWTAPCCQGFQVTTQPAYVSNNDIASTAYVQFAIRNTMATVPLAGITGGTYSFASNGTQGLASSVTAVAGAVTALSGFSSGTGWKVGDMFTLTGSCAGNGDAIIRVLSLSGSTPATYEILYGGTAYVTNNCNFVAPPTLSSFTLTLTGVLASDATFVMPKGTYLLTSDQWIVNNNTTGAHTVTVKISNGSDTATGTGVVIPQGSNNSTATILQTDGVNDVWLGLGGTSSGTVNAGTAGQLAYYASSTTAVSGLSTGNINSSPTITGNWTFNPTSGTAITITTAVGATQGIANNQTGNNSGTIGSTNYSYNPWTMTNDGLNASTFNAVTSGYSMVMSTGGSNSGGTKVGIYSLLSHNAASSPGNDRDHIATQATCIASVSDGGTNTGAGSQGTCFGGNSSAALLSGATNHTEVVGWECDSAINTGASAKWRVGCGAVALGNLTGAAVDAAFELGAVSTPWLAGLIINDAHGAQAIATTGSVITSNNSTNTGQSAVTLANFVNLPSINFTGNLFSFAHLTITGAGAITANNYGLGLIHSSAGGVFTSSAVVSADLNITTTTCTNQFLTAISATGTGTCTTDTLASAQHANQGTTTTVLHGNAAGNPSFGAVALTTDVSGTLPVANGGTNDTGTAWSAYTPTLSCGTGSLTTATPTGRFKTLGKTVWFEAKVAMTTNGTCAVFLGVTLPVTAQAGIDSFTNSNPNTSVGGHCYVTAGASVMNCLTYNAVYPLADGQNLYITGVYESS